MLEVEGFRTIGKTFLKELIFSIVIVHYGLIKNSNLVVILGKFPTILLNPSIIVGAFLSLNVSLNVSTCGLW